jgi:thiol-disulfide isomerase/thioredoxin
MNKRWITPTAILFVAIAVGCTDNPKQSKVSGSGTGLPVATTKPVPIALKLIDRAAYDANIARHKGKVVLVDFWATWCPPCVEQLPHSLELGRQFADRGLAVVTVSCDEKSEAGRVAEFLATKKADVATNLISEFGSSTATMEEFKIENGAVPSYKLYDRKGELRQTFGMTTPGEIDQAIEKLLSE